MVVYARILFEKRRRIMVIGVRVPFVWKCRVELRKENVFEVREPKLREKCLRLLRSKELGTQRRLRNGKVLS